MEAYRHPTQAVLSPQPALALTRCMALCGLGSQLCHLKNEDYCSTCLTVKINAPSKQSRT